MKNAILGAALGACAVVFLTLPAAAQRKYTNADLEKYRLAGAYTNEDLKRLEPLSYQAAPLFEYPEIDLLSASIAEQRAIEVRGDVLRQERRGYQAELDYHNGRLKIAYSAGGGYPNRFLNRGLLSQIEPRLEILRRRIALITAELGRLGR